VKINISKPNINGSKKLGKTYCPAQNGKPTLDTKKAMKDYIKEKKRRCLQLARKLFKCGGRSLPSGDRVVGTSQVFMPRMDALMTISLASSLLWFAGSFFQWLLL
jgi:hypothetical protein